MARQIGKIARHALEIVVLFTLMKKSFPKTAIKVRRPTAADKADNARFVPVREARLHGILHDFLEIRPEEERVDIYLGNSFPHLPAQFIVVACETHKNFVFKDPEGAAFLRHEKLPQPDVRLLHVGRIRVHDQLDAVVDTVLHHPVDFLEVEFGKFYGGMRHVARLAIPEGEKIVAFIAKPIVEIIVVLHPVFAESLFNDLALQSCAKDGESKNQQYRSNVTMHTRE